MEKQVVSGVRVDCSLNEEDSLIARVFNTGAVSIVGCRYWRRKNAKIVHCEKRGERGLCTYHRVGGPTFAGEFKEY